MEKIVFQNSDGVQVFSMRFVGAGKIDENGRFDIIDYEISVDYNVFRAMKSFSCRDEDLIRFLADLNAMHRGEIERCCFHPMIDKLFFWGLEYSDTCGHIQVIVSISDGLPGCRLEVKYLIDQSFLPKISTDLTNNILAGIPR